MNLSNKPIIKGVYTPTPEMRTNPLSLVEGGVTVTIIYDGYVVEYTNIKQPVQYVTSVRKRSTQKVVGYIVNGKTTIL